MNIAILGTDPTETNTLKECLPGHVLHFHSGPLDDGFASCPQMAPVEALCVFVHDRVSAGLIAGLPNLRLIVTRSTGFDNIDIDAANRAGITVCNVPTYGDNTVAEFTFGLILALSRNIHRAYVRSKQGDFSLAGLQGSDLKEKTIGVIGTGHIGLHVARIAKGFWMNVVACDPYPQQVYADLLGFTYTTLDDLLEKSDIVTLHTPLTPETRHLMTAERFGLMRRGAMLINTGRGGLVDTPALLNALDSGHLGGAALDVIEDEGRLGEIGPALLDQRPNLLLTPHMAFDSREAVGRILDTTVENIRRYTAGDPCNVVSGPTPDSNSDHIGVVDES